MVSDPDTVQVFLAAIADGNYRETACKLAGISKQTLYNTIKRAEHGDNSAQAFVDALEKAEALAESETVRNVRQASKLPQFWAAGMTWLERKSPDRWGRRSEDGNAPRVVVQIGVKDSDVTVNVVSPATHNDLPMISTGQVEHMGPINGDYVNQPRALAAPDPAGGPIGGGVAPLPARESGRIKRAGKKKA
jgi:hypothetical protein